MIRIIEADFITSAPSIEETLPDGISEVAFLGRSNVGKSSLINALTNRKNLAKSSSTPGKTRLINFFDITFLKDQEKYKTRLVDLPGFGYAKVAKSLKKEWQKNLTLFIEERNSIRLFIHLVDARHPDLDIDKQVIEYLKKICRPDQKILVVFTKSDKLKQNELAALKRSHPDGVLVSNTKNKGLEKLTESIFNSLFDFGMNNDTI